ncbi:MAG: DUF3581 family protein [Psychromonas sp.]|nr:DUF3581 family protein [Psychromonas sp.]
MLKHYYSERDSFNIISAEQASTFAKVKCCDFNPIHDPGNKRFCVPGDLLFAIALNKYGISKSMAFTFMAMVPADIGLVFPETDESNIIICDEKQKNVLEIDRSGEISHDSVLIESVTKNYVQFSGKTFPSLLMPLMKEHQIMFNISSPLVIYHSISFELDTLKLKNNLQLKHSSINMELNHKRANCFVYFDLFDGKKIIGRGMKKLIIAGIKPYDEKLLTEFAEKFIARRDSFKIAVI